MTIKREWDFKVPYRNIRTVNQEMKEAALRVLDSGLYHTGWEGLEFEKDFVKMFGCKHAVTMNSGTSALVSAFMACDVGPGDEIILSPFVFWGAADVIAQIGATPVFVEADPHTFNIDPNQIEAAITERTKAVMSVDLGGFPVDYDEIKSIINEPEIRSKFRPETENQEGAAHESRI